MQGGTQTTDGETVLGESTASALTVHRLSMPSVLPPSRDVLFEALR